MAGASSALLSVCTVFLYPRRCAYLCRKETSDMESIFLTSLSGRVYFTSAMPNVYGSGSAGKATKVTIVIDSVTYFEEALWSVDGNVWLRDLGEFLSPYLKSRLVSSVTITMGTTSAIFTAIYAKVDVGISADDFYNGYFLSTLLGTKITAKGRRELLWYYGSDSATVTAEFADGTTAAIAATVVGGSGKYTCLDASPDLFDVGSSALVAYTVRAGNRSQRFEIDPTQPDCAPILEFYNSFGVWEYIYCTGTHQVSPEYKRSSARIGGRLRNYKIEKTRTFKADTGIMNTAMANWADELFRSEEVYVVNIIDGSVTSSDGGKEVVITESKSDNSNDDDHMPRFTFSYQYAQRIQNVLQMNRVGRIFDNTFDHTFN